MFLSLNVQKALHYASVVLMQTLYVYTEVVVNSYIRLRMHVLSAFNIYTFSYTHYV